MIRAIRNVLAIEAPSRVKLYAGIMGLGFVVSALEVVGIGLIFPLIMLFAEPAKIAEFPSLMHVRKLLSIESDKMLLLLLASAVVSVSLARLAIKALYFYCQAIVSQYSGKLVAENLLERYMRMPYVQFIKRDVGVLVRNITVLPYGPFSGSALAITNLLSDSLVLFGLFAVMLAAEPYALGAAVAVIGGLLGLLYVPLRRRNQLLGANANNLLAKRVSVAKQTLGDAKLLRVFAAEQYMLRVNRRTLDQYASNSWRLQLLTSLPPLVIEAIFIAGLVTTVAVLYLNAGGPSEIFASLALFAAAAIRLLAVSNRIMGALNTLHRHEAGLQTLVTELEEPFEPEEEESAPPLPFEHEIKLSGVGYQHDARPEQAIADIDLVIRKGEMFGIIGPSGAGKSTLVDVILTILTPTRGELTVDGFAVADAAARWRQNLAYVPQDIFLFDDSVRRNIAYGLRGRDIDDERVWEALRAVQLEEVVRSLPDKLDARLGHGGTGLSGGQLQRIGIARAIYYRRPVIVLDEVTSALDAETEQALTDTLERFKGSHTLIIISHRMSTLRACDRIVHLRNGRVEAVGTPDMVMRENHSPVTGSPSSRADRDLETDVHHLLAQK